MMLRGNTLPIPRTFKFFTFSCLALITMWISASAPAAFADGTRTWEQSKFDELTKGTATGVAIRSSGGLELAPSFKLFYATPSTYIWAVASDDAGNIYAATGSPARVYRITPDGQAAIIFEPQELQVQALEVGPHGVIYAATAPDGKVYKIEHKPPEKGGAPKSGKPEGPDSKNQKDAPKDPAKPTLDSSWSSSEYFAPGTKYIWNLVLDKTGNLYVATGDHGEIYKVTPKGEHSVFFKSDDTHIRVLALDAQGNVIAGTDGSGLVYRISPAGEGFVLYSAAKKEITALALDRQGNIYAAGVGEKRAGTTSPVGPSPMISMGATPPSTGLQTPGMTLTMTPNNPPVGPFPFPAEAQAVGPTCTGSRPMVLRPAYGPRTKTSFTRWLSIRTTSCSPEPETADMFSPLKRRMNFPICSRRRRRKLPVLPGLPAADSTPPAATSERSSSWVQARRTKAPTRATCSTPKFFPAGAAPSFAALATSICWPAAAT